MQDPCAIILLAAGTSSRLGKPKQLLAYKGTTLLTHSIQVALGSMAQRVVVVLGAGERSEPFADRMEPSE